MKLHVVEDTDGVSVWVEDVPADVRDSEVQAAFETVGGATYQRACALIGHVWVHLNGDAVTRGVRVYADN